MKHSVRQGEHIASIAAHYGFGNPDSIWMHPDNAELRRMRHPNTLLPGDEVSVPDLEVKTVRKPTGATHVFRLKSRPLLLRLRITGPLGEPLSNVSGRFEAEDRAIDVTTDGNGVLEQPIRPDVERAGLTLGEHEYSLLIGHLDPPETRTGVLARLNDLGYPAGDPADLDPDQLAFAIRLFQFDNGLEPTGEIDSRLTDKLEECFGC